MLACLVGPCVEEILFRGVLFSALRRRMTAFMAIFTSAAIFSVLHTNVVGFVPIMVLGGFLAALYARTGSLASSMAVHVVHNLFLVGLGFTLKALVT